MKACSIDGCEKGGKIVRGWCRAHYERWSRYGDPLTTLHHSDHEDAFLARTEPLVWSGCIVWTGALTNGYGCLRVNGRTVYAHRYAWERVNGPIPDDKVIDHTCWERSCVNVDHLRIATHQQNLQSRAGAESGRKHNLPRGVYRDGKGYRAMVGHNSIQHHLGTFPTIEAASEAAATKRSILFGEYAGAN